LSANSLVLALTTSAALSSACKSAASEPVAAAVLGALVSDAVLTADAGVLTAEAEGFVNGLLFFFSVRSVTNADSALTTHTDERGCAREIEQPNDLQ
jgi:hypothetical protein